jgi:NADPH:quinone reductase-like Zn-dependent oxidoreductase
MGTLQALLNVLAAGQIEPVVAEQIPLVEAAKTHKLLVRGGHAEKGVIANAA